MDGGKNRDRLACSFSLGEQIYAQTTFHAWWISGFIAIALQSWIWAAVYFVIVAYGILGIVQRHLTCPRCPHLHEYGSCLQLHPRISRSLIKAKKSHPFSLTEKTIFVVVFLLITLFPVYWLMAQKMALAGFVIFGSMWYLGQFLYFCKHCRVFSCPFNRVVHA